MKSSLFGSWRTSLAGWAVGLILILRSLAGLGGAEVPVIENGSVVLDEQGEVVTEPSGEFNLDVFLAGLAMLGIGTAARDNGVSSERAKAK